MTHTQGSRSRRVDEFSRFFPRTRRSSSISRSQMAVRQIFQKVFPPPHFFVKNTTTVFFFFSVQQKPKKVQCKAQVNLPWKHHLTWVLRQRRRWIFGPLLLSGGRNWFSLFLPLSLSLSLSLSLFLYNLRNTREVHRILLRFRRFRIRNFHEIVTKWGTQNKRHSDTGTAEGFGWDTVTAGLDHAKTSEKALTDTSKFGFYLRSFLPA